MLYLYAIKYEIQWFWRVLYHREEPQCSKKSRTCARAAPSAFIVPLTGSNVGPEPMHGLPRTTGDAEQRQGHKDGFNIPLCHPRFPVQITKSFPSPPRHYHPGDQQLRPPVPLGLNVSQLNMGNAFLKLGTYKFCILLDLQGMGPYLWLEHDTHFFKPHVIIAWKGSRGTCEQPLILRSFPLEHGADYKLSLTAPPPNTPLKFVVNNIVQVSAGYAAFLMSP